MRRIQDVAGLVGLVVLVWVLRRVLDANSRVVDELGQALKRATGGGAGIELDEEGVPRFTDYTEPRLTDAVAPDPRLGWLPNPLAKYDVAGATDDEVRAAAAEVQALTNQLTHPETYLDHTDEFMPDEPDVLFGPPVTVPPQNFIKDFSEVHSWPDGKGS